MNIESSEATGSRAAVRTVLAAELQAAERDLEGYLAAGSDPWETVFRGLARGRLWLTQEEARDVTETLEGKIEQYAKGRSAARRPRGARRASFTWSLVPLEPPMDGAGASAEFP